VFPELGDGIEMDWRDSGWESGYSEEHDDIEDTGGNVGRVVVEL
jgi:hypothetical protein